MTKRSLARLAPGLLLPALFAVASPGYSGAVVANSGSSTHVSRVTLTARHSLGSLKALAAHAPRAAASSGGGFESVSKLVGQVNRSLSRRVQAGGGNLSRAAAAAATLSVPNVVPAPVVAGPRTTSFDGINDYQNRYVSGGGNQYTITPPDQGLCVNSSFVFESVNQSVQVFTKAGTPLTPPTSLNQFYGLPPQIDRTAGGYPGPSPTDPSCYFDPSVQRWFNVVNFLGQDPKTGALTLQNWLDIAVSKTSDPTGGWYFYMFSVIDDGSNGIKHKDCPCLGDYPHIGMDANGFYITTNEYPWLGTTTGVYGNDFNGAQLYGFSKKALVAEQKVVQGVAIDVGADKNGTPSFTLWPNEVPGAAWDTRHKGSEWFLQSSATLETLNALGLNNKLTVWRLSNTKALDGDVTKVSLQNTVVDSETYGVPPPSEQKYGPVPLRDCLVVMCLGPGSGPSKNEVESAIDSNDSRMQADWLTNNKLYGALDTIADINGRYQAAVFYFVVNAADTMSAVSIANQGYVGVAGNITYPSIATAPGGFGAMGVTLVGNNYYPTAAAILMGPTGPVQSVGIVAPGVGPDDEFCGYLYFNCTQTPYPGIRPRWGDYGAAAFDGSSVWLGTEYIGQSCTIDQYQVDPHCNSTRATLGNWYTRITQVGLG